MSTPPSAKARITVMHGDQTGEELLQQALRLATEDLGGGLGTEAFTDEVIRRVSTKLEVWATLA